MRRLLLAAMLWSLPAQAEVVWDMTEMGGSVVTSGEGVSITVDDVPSLPEVKSAKETQEPAKRSQGGEPLTALAIYHMNIDHLEEYLSLNPVSKQDQMIEIYSTDTERWEPMFFVYGMFIPYESCMAMVGMMFENVAEYRCRKLNGE